MFASVFSMSRRPALVRSSGDHSCFNGCGDSPIEIPSVLKVPATSDVPPRPEPRTMTVRTTPKSRFNHACFTLLTTNVRGSSLASLLQIAAAPFQFLANDAEEGDAGQGCEWQALRGFADPNRGTRLDVHRLPSVHGKKDGVIA